MPLETFVPTITHLRGEAHREMIGILKQFHRLKERKKTFPLCERSVMRACVNSKAAPSGIPTRRIMEQVCGYAQRSPNV